MKRFPTPAPSMLVALLALFVAVGGTSYAATIVGSKQIKNNSVRGIDVKNRSLTGKDVKRNGLGGAQLRESGLSKVPNAALADSAGSAASAGTVRSAQRAVNAGSVKTAKTATSAAQAPKAASTARAGDATTLGGHPESNLAHDVLYDVETTPLDSNDDKAVTAHCPAGMTVLGGGADLSGPNTADIVITGDHPLNDGGSWRAAAIEANLTGDPWRLRVEITCAAT